MTSGGKNPPSPPQAPTIPVTAATRSAGANSATQAKTPPVPSPRKRAIRTKEVPAGISGDSRNAMINDITAAPANEVATTLRGLILSATMPPIGLAITAAIAKPAVLVPAPVKPNV